MREIGRERETTEIENKLRVFVLFVRKRKSIVKYGDKPYTLFSIRYLALFLMQKDNNNA